MTGYDTVGNRETGARFRLPERGIMKGWILLVIAILFEVAGTTNVKLSEGFSRLVPSVLIFVSYGLAFLFFTLAVKTIEISTAYAVWSGLGTAVIALIGMAWFRETASLLKFAFLLVIIIGVVGLNLVDRGSP